MFTIGLQGDHISRAFASFDSTNFALYQVRCPYDNCAAAVEIQKSAVYLHTAGVFILSSAQLQFIWCGKFSTDKLKTAAKSVSELIKNPSVGEQKLIAEGNEPPQFWEILGDKDAYKPKTFKDSRSIYFLPKLFTIRNGRQFKVERILPFSQDDLQTEDVFLLDTFEEIFLWFGQKSLEKNQKLMIQVAQVRQ